MLASNVKNHVHFPRNVDEWNIIREILPNVKNTWNWWMH